MNDVKSLLYISKKLPLRQIQEPSFLSREQELFKGISKDTIECVESVVLVSQYPFSNGRWTSPEVNTLFDANN